MLQTTDPQLDMSVDEIALDTSVDEIASQALGSLYTDVLGGEPLALCAFRDGDALLLLLRFDRELLEDADETRFGPLSALSFMALPELVAEVVRLRTSRTLVPGSLSVSEERGLAVFAFSVLDVACDPDVV